MPEGEMDCFVSTSLFQSIKELYPDHDLYVACAANLGLMFFGNDYIHKVLEYDESFNNLKNFENEDGDDLFEVVYTPHLNKNNFDQIARTNH